MSVKITTFGPDGQVIAVSDDGETLAQAIARRTAEAVDRTAVLRAAGFAYSGKRFGLTSDSRLNWLSLLIGAQNGLITLPISVGSIDGSSMPLSDLTAVNAFVITAASAVDAIESGETAFIAALNAATTVAAVDAVQDTRG